MLNCHLYDYHDCGIIMSTIGIPILKMLMAKRSMVRSLLHFTWDQPRCWTVALQCSLIKRYTIYSIRQRALTISLHSTQLFIRQNKSKFHWLIIIDYLVIINYFGILIQVMWTRQGTERPFLLTLGKDVHISNPRYSINFQYPNNWRLTIESVRRDDNGQYACQVNTHPPKTLITDVNILGNNILFSF